MNEIRRLECYYSRFRDVCQKKEEGVSKYKFRHTLLSCIRVSKVQGAEIEDEGSVLKYMTKSEVEATQWFAHYDTTPCVCHRKRVRYSSPVATIPTVFSMIMISPVSDAVWR